MSLTLAQYIEQAKIKIDELSTPASGKFSDAWWTSILNEVKDIVADYVGFNTSDIPVAVDKYQIALPVPTGICQGIKTVMLGNDTLVYKDMDLLNSQNKGWRFHSPFPNQPGSGTFQVLSSDASDTTQTVTVVGFDAETGKRVSESINLTGTTAVTSTVAMTEVYYASLDAVCVGTVTIRKTTGSATISTIAIGETEIGELPNYATPTHYTIDGDWMYLYPAPDEAVTLYINAATLPDNLADSTDTIIGVPRQFAYVLVAGMAATAQGVDLYSEVQSGRYSIYGKEFWDGVARFKNRIVVPTTEKLGPLEVTNIWGA